MNIAFTKMHSIGNDFMVVNNAVQPLVFGPEKIRQLAHRQIGIGFDQLLLIEKSTKSTSDFLCRIFNQDGTEAQQCGNGIRCAAKFIWDNQLSCKKILRIQTDAQISAIEKKQDLFTATLDPPSFLPQDLPFLVNHEAVTYPLEIDNEIYNLSVVSLGNPHAVIIVNKIEKQNVEKIGSALQDHPAFPQKTNVEFVQILSRTLITLSVFERGVGETLACGSGACAAVVSAIRRGLLEKTVLVKMALGALEVTWEGSTNPILLTGPATTSFTGEISLL